MLKVEFHNPDFPDGVVFDLGGIAVPNNGELELDESTELMFYARHGKGVKDQLAASPHVTVSGKTELSTKQREAYPGDAGEAPTETEIEVVDEEGEPTTEVVASDEPTDDEAHEGSES